MTDYPHQFREHMVRALLREIEQPGSGKTQFRMPLWHRYAGEIFRGFDTPDWYVRPSYLHLRDSSVRVPLPYRPGDRLWIREAWNTDPATGAPVYRVSDVKLPTWRTPMHQPREATRLTALVTHAHFQKLQNLSEDDARAEGVFLGDSTSFMKAFRREWISLHRLASWERNPYVAVIHIRPLLTNIDDLSRSETEAA